jgi:hypothetical protein
MDPTKFSRLGLDSRSAFAKGWRWDKEGEEYEDIRGNVRKRGCYIRDTGSPFLEAKSYGIVRVDVTPRQRCKSAMRCAHENGRIDGNSGGEPSEMAGILHALDANTKMSSR